jgi:hypothetical protein
MRNLIVTFIADVVESLTGFFQTFEKLTRPPRRTGGFDADEPVGDDLWKCAASTCGCQNDDRYWIHGNNYSLQAFKDAMWPHGKAYDGWPDAEAARLKNSPASSAAGASPAGVEHPPVPPAGIPVSIHDLRQAADLLSTLSRPTDPHNYDCAALGERLSAAADSLADPPKPAFMETGLDMGARLDGCSFAADTFPQHTKPQK